MYLKLTHKQLYSNVYIRGWLADPGMDQSLASDAKMPTEDDQRSKDESLWTCLNCGEFSYHRSMVLKGRKKGQSGKLVITDEGLSCPACSYTVMSKVSNENFVRVFSTQ